MTTKTPRIMRPGAPRCTVITRAGQRCRNPQDPYAPPGLCGTHWQLSMKAKRKAKAAAKPARILPAAVPLAHVAIA